jgi:hypothetical protein
LHSPSPDAALDDTTRCDRNRDADLKRAAISNLPILNDHRKAVGPAATAFLRDNIDAPVAVELLLC